MAEPRTLWILGAGASKHLDLPLLLQFPQFIADVMRHPRNQAHDDQSGRDASNATYLLLAKHNWDIETLLAECPRVTLEGQAARQCIRWCFFKRHRAIMNLRVILNKYAAYSYLLTCLGPSDTIVNFNYDLAVERTIKNVHRSADDHKRAPRIPSECLDQIRGLTYTLPVVNQVNTFPGARSFNLIKLHGSINWEEQNGHLHERGFDEAVTNPFMVYPDPKKGELQSGSAALLVEKAKAALADADNVVVAGYSLPPSDRANHPFLTHLAAHIERLSLHIVSPEPSECLCDLARNAKHSEIWRARFEDMFAATQTQQFRRSLG